MCNKDNNDLKTSIEVKEDLPKNNLTNLVAKQVKLSVNLFPLDNPLKTEIFKSIDILKYQSPLEQFIKNYKNQFNYTQNIIKKTNFFSEQIKTINNPLYNTELYNAIKDINFGRINNLNIFANINTAYNLENSVKSIIDALDINSVFKNVSSFLNYIGKIFETIDFKSLSRLSGLDSKILDQFYWVIPFEYEYNNIQKLSKYTTWKEFEEYILKYFNVNRTKRLFSKIKKQCKSKDKKELVKQVENAYFREDYAICITSLITMLDGLTLQLLEPNSENQHLSYKIIESMLNYINSCPLDEYSYEVYIRVDILNNFYLKLYSNEKNFKMSKTKTLSRHLNSNGVRYLNKKVEVLRLLNAIYFCQSIIDETELQEMFTRNTKERKFDIISSNN